MRACVRVCVCALCEAPTLEGGLQKEHCQMHKPKNHAFCASLGQSVQLFSRVYIT